MSVVENLSQDYPGFKLNIPRWEIPDMGITALVGPSGSGKTTVFRLLLGLESCPRLKWVHRGVDLASLSPPDRNIGVVFQSLELFPHMTARENILFAARARDLDGAMAQSRLRELEQDLQLGACMSRSAAVLSGGEAQRVALARAVIAGPRFLFLDEPFSALDRDLRQGARQLVRKVIERLSIPTLLITHDAEDLEAMGAQVTRIQGGALFLS